MIDSDIYFYLYLLIITAILIFLSVLVLPQAKLFFANLAIFLTIREKCDNILSCSEKMYCDLLSLYFSRSEYYLCILVCESYLRNSSFSKNKKQFYINLANSYAQIHYWELAKYYYLEAFTTWDKDAEIMSKLINLHKYLGYDFEAKDLSVKIKKTSKNT
uniref:Photosystem I assembly protein Ycf37 n=1 Tax=Polysiphonia sertularioides TaxID=945028 RepID=A0A1Z1MG59_9FLOR|nr:hypothetical protein [Polysiphonia sertularioides]